MESAVVLQELLRELLERDAERNRQLSHAAAALEALAVQQQSNLLTLLAATSWMQAVTRVLTPWSVVTIR